MEKPEETKNFAIVFDTKIFPPIIDGGPLVIQLTVATATTRFQVKFDDGNIDTLITMMENLKRDVQTVKEDMAKPLPAEPPPKPKKEVLH